MAPQHLQQQRQPAGVLHAALLLLCLALLMRASVTSTYARPVPSENDNRYNSDIARQYQEHGSPSQQMPPIGRPLPPNSGSHEDNLKDCASRLDFSSEPCASDMEGRMLGDYGNPGGSSDSHPGGPIP